MGFEEDLLCDVLHTRAFDCVTSEGRPLLEDEQSC